MIGYLKGEPLRLTPELALVDVGGVGYELHIPLSTYSRLEDRPEGSPVELFVYTHLRDDGLTLFGFATEGEKLVFERLLSISGIGPRLARTILSGSSPAELFSAIAAGDIARLSKTPGVGKKTAQRIVLELKDKVQELAASLPEAPAPAPTSEVADLASALVNLGYPPSLAERTIDAVRRKSPEASSQELLRDALKRLAKA